MKVAVSSSGKSMDSQIDPRFGRCAYFLIVETDDMSFECFENENATLGGGAGIQSAQFIASRGAKAVITGNCGPNAVQTLSATGIELYVGQTSTVKDGITKLISGELATTNEPNAPEFYGLTPPDPRNTSQPLNQNSGMGMGRGRGGRGMCGGRGNGRGMGMGGGRGRTGR